MNRHAALKAAMGSSRLGLSVCAHAQVLKDPLPDSFTLPASRFTGRGCRLRLSVQVCRSAASMSVASNTRPSPPLATSRFTVDPGGKRLEQSKIGIRIEEPMAYGFTLVGRLETGFNPLSAQLTDACAAIAENSGVPQASRQPTPTAVVAVNPSTAWPLAV